jgi:hypothetical protein
MTDPNPAQRRDWWSNNYECVMPADPDERAAYEAQLADEAENGPAA